MKCAIRRLAIAVVMTSLTVTSQSQADEGFYSNVDLLFLSPKLNAVGFNNLFYLESPRVQTVDGNTEANLEFSQRVTIGYEGDQGGASRYVGLLLITTLAIRVSEKVLAGRLPSTVC